jgi:hypothetical protein
MNDTVSRMSSFSLYDYLAAKFTSLHRHANRGGVVDEIGQETQRLMEMNERTFKRESVVDIIFGGCIEDVYEHDIRSCNAVASSASVSNEKEGMCSIVD